EITIPIAGVRPAAGVTGAAEWPVVGVVPVELRIIEKELDSFASALVRQLLQWIARERRPIHDVVARRLRRKHREAVVMATRDRDVSDAGPFREQHPFARVELYGIERRREPLVAVDVDAAILHHPFA